jgi:hypothetical protein
MTISRREVKKTLMITTGYTDTIWQARRADASAAVQAIDS